MKSRSRLVLPVGQVLARGPICIEPLELLLCLLPRLGGGDGVRV